MLKTVSKCLEWTLVFFCVFLMAALAILIVWGVTTRKLGASLSWYDEVASIMLAWITYYGAALAALKRAHLGFPNLVAAAPPPLRVALVIIAEVIVIGFFGLVTWFGYQVIMLLWGDTLISLPWVTTQFSQSVIPIAGALFILAELLTVPERLREAARGAAPVDPERVLEEATT